MKFGKVLGAIAVAVAVQACGGSSGAGSCQVSVAAENYSYCEDYVGSGWTTSSVKSACTASSGTYSSGACAAGTNGTCDLDKGTSAEVKWTFGSTGAGDAGAAFNAQSVCTAGGGTFTQ